MADQYSTMYYNRRSVIECQYVCPNVSVSIIEQLDNGNCNVYKSTGRIYLATVRCISTNASYMTALFIL